MPDGLHQQDVLSWAQRQASLLRRLASGERLNEPVDWPNVIKEVHGVGLSQLRACRSLLQQALRHLLRLHAWPNSRSAEHWRDELFGLLSGAAGRFSPSMGQRIPLDALYAEALRQARASKDDSGPPRPLPDACPFSLQELLAADMPALEAKLHPSV